MRGKTPPRGRRVVGWSRSTIATIVERMNQTLPSPDAATYVPPAQPTDQPAGPPNWQPTAQPAAQPTQRYRTDRLVRPRRERRIGGVCAGIAHRFGWDPVMVRLATVLSIFLPGPQVLVYAIAWLVLPSDDDVQYAALPGAAPQPGGVVAR